MKFTAKQYAKGLLTLLSQTIKKDEVLDGFVKLLHDNNDLRLFPQIAREIERLELEKKGVTLVEVVSARELSRAELNEIKSVLSRILGKKVEIRNKIESDLIAGIKVRVDDLVLDTTVKNTLEQLRNSLVS